MAGMSDVYMNSDEPVEIRRAKAILRKTGANAKHAGEIVEIRYDHLTICDMTYTLDELHKLPDKHQQKDVQDEGLDQACGGMDPDMETEAPPMNDRRERYATARRRINPQPNYKLQGLVLPDEHMRVRASGLLFSGPTAYPSNLYKAPIKYQDKDYNCNEQCYQCNKAEKHYRDDLAAAMMEMSESCEIKDEAGNIELSDEGNDLAPDFLMELFYQKMKQNLHLLERLILTAPLQLIEASKSTKWGGGAPFHSKLYDGGKYPGGNRFGMVATSYRDQKIQETENLVKN